MATTTVTPPASAPAAAPSTPAAAPSTPVTTTAPATTAAPETTAPVTASETTSEPKSMSDRLAEGWEKAKAAVPLEEKDETIPETEATTETAETTETPEVEAAPETKTEETAETPETTETPEVTADAVEWDDGDVADPAALANELKNDPAAQKFFEDRPALKGQIFGALRRDKENREIRSYIPDVETAKIVTGAATAFQNIDNKFLGATTPEGVQGFLNHWIQEAMILDDQGKPIMGADGKYQLHPSLPYIFEHISGNKLKVYADQVGKTGKIPEQLAPIVDALRSFAVTKGDERLQAVADVLKEVMSPSSSGSEEIPDALKPFAEKLQAERADLDKQKRADADRQQREQQAAHLQSIDRAESKAAESVKGQLKQRFESSGLTEFEQASALREIGDQIEAHLGRVEADGSWTKGSHPSSPMFQSLYDSIIKNNAPGEAREKKLTKHLLTYTQQILGPITAQVMRAAKKGALDRQAEKKTTVDSQTRVSKVDPRGTSIAASRPQASTPAQMRTQVIADLTKQLGREPEMSEVMKETWARVNAPKR